MTEMQAALGRIQLKRLDQWVHKRREHAQKIHSTIEDFSSVRTTLLNQEFEHAFYKYYFFIKPEKLQKGWSRNKIIAELNHNGVPCFQGICPEVYLENAFEKSKLKPPQRLEKAKVLGETSLMLLVHPTLTQEEIEKQVLGYEKYSLLQAKTLLFKQIVYFRNRCFLV